MFVGGGLYFVEAPIVLTPEDSGLVLAAYPGAKPVLSGGRPITGWKEVTVKGKELWAADIPEVRDGKWYFRELWVNGQRATRARHPNQGYLGIAELLDKAAEWTQGHTRFRFREGDLKAWDTVTNAEVVAMTRWVESRLPVIGVDEKEHIVSFSKRSVFELAPGDLYYAEGAFEFLDEPGEWYLDAATGTLYYLPRPGERLAEIQAIAPVLAQVVRFEGRPEAGQFVERVALRGLTFSHTEWYFPAGFHSGKNKPNISPAPKAEIGGFAQAAVGVPGAVWGDGRARLCLRGLPVFEPRQLRPGAGARLPAQPHHSVRVLGPRRGRREDRRDPHPRPGRRAGPRQRNQRLPHPRRRQDVRQRGGHLDRPIARQPHHAQPHPRLLLHGHLHRLDLGLRAVAGNATIPSS